MNILFTILVQTCNIISTFWLVYSRETSSFPNYVLFIGNATFLIKFIMDIFTGNTIPYNAFSNDDLCLLYKKNTNILC